jgi:hypothetical protein
MKYWFDPLALCMVTGRTSNGASFLNSSLTFYQTLTKCRENSTKLVGSPFNLLPSTFCPDGLCTLPSSTFANKVRGWCCTEDLPFTERGFDLVAQGYDKPYAQPILEVLEELSRRNMSLVFLGDSMNGQFFSAFEQERRREEILRGRLNRSVPLDSEPTDRLWWALSGTVSRKTLRHIPTRSIWTPINSSGNKVYIYGVSSNDLSSPEDDEIMHSVLPLLSHSEHPGGIFFIGNIGHHLSGLRNQDNPVAMNVKMSHILEMFAEIGLSNPSNKIAFRETTPAHFNAPDLSGSFEKWERSTNKFYNYSTYNDWDKSLYWCRAISNFSSRQSNTKENEAVKSILHYWGPNVFLLPTFRYLAPFYKMKYGHCGGFSRIDVLDCVHLCAFSPTMWFPIWFHVLKIAKSSVQTEQTLGFNRSVSRLYIKNNSYPEELYVLQHGLLRKVENEACLHDFGLEPNKSRPHFISEYDLENIPRGPPLGERMRQKKSYPNNTLLKLTRGREIFIVIDDIKRSIPNFDTFVAMKLDLSNVINISPDEMNSVPTGPSMPVLF